MPFALVTIGLIMIVTGARNTHGEMAAQIREDFTGEGNFTYWLVAIGALGMMGYSDTLRPFSRWFMALIIVAMILSNEGFFAKFTSALSSGPVETKTAPAGGGVSTGSLLNTLSDMQQPIPELNLENAEARARGTFARMVTVGKTLAGFF